MRGIGWRRQQRSIERQNVRFDICELYERQGAHGLAFERSIKGSHEFRARIDHRYQGEADSQYELAGNYRGDDASCQRETFHYVWRLQAERLRISGDIRHRFGEPPITSKQSLTPTSGWAEGRSRARELCESAFHCV